MKAVLNRVVAVAGVGLLAWASALLPSPAAIEAVKAHEGVALVAYADPVGIPTICYGTTKGVKLGDKATPALCDEWLHRDLTYAGKGIAKGVTHRLTQGQYDALLSFVYNVGETKFYKSTLLRKLNAGDCVGASAEFSRWVYAKGKRLNGLVTRRASERSLFEQGCYLW